MKIGGFIKSSLVDYPGKVAAVIFTQSCNFRCAYCHNRHLVYPELFGEQIAFEEIISFLEKRRSLLDGVVFCGGEPTLQDDLCEKILKVRSLGYAVKLDTNGSRPDILAEALPFLDYLAMDIKAPFGPGYSKVCGIEVDEWEISRSMLLIRASGVKYEFRTTIDPRFISPGDIAFIRSMLGKNEVYRTIQAVISNGDSDH